MKREAWIVFAAFIIMVACTYYWVWRIHEFMRVTGFGFLKAALVLGN